MAFSLHRVPVPRPRDAHVRKYNDRCMKCLALLLFLTPLTSGLRGQTPTYQDDVDALYRILQKTPAYKDQVRGARKKAYEALYQSIRNDTSQPNGYFHDYHKLARLLFPLRDNHFGFNQMPAALLRREFFGNPDSVLAYRSSAFYRHYPRTSLDLDSLEAELKRRNKDSVEGIYYYDRYLSVGLYRDDEMGRYTGVVLSSALPAWERGQVAITLYGKSPGTFRAVYGHPVYKNYVLVTNEKFQDHALVNARFSSSVSSSCYRKDTLGADYVNLADSDIYFAFRNLSPSIQYVRVRTFTNYHVLAGESRKLLRLLRDSARAPHLIVDLRNNEGGNVRMGEGYVRFIREYARRNHVHVLVNNGTMSAGEIILLGLKGMDHVTVYGQTTRGTLAYGNNYGKTEMLPRGFYGLYVSDMKDKDNLLRYEDIGVAPDVILSASRDWLDQVRESIESGDRPRHP